MNRRLWATMVVAAAVVGVMASPALAEGDETLGPADITLADGTGFAIGGVGMFGTGSGTISVDVPAGATVTQVLLYWDGQTSGANAPDDTAVVEGSSVTGEALSSVPIPFFDQANLPVNASAFRADITSLGLIAAGANSVDVSGLDFQRNGKNITNGAGIVVVYDDGSGLKEHRGPRRRRHGLRWASRRRVTRRSRRPTRSRPTRSSARRRSSPSPPACSTPRPTGPTR